MSEFICPECGYECHPEDIPLDETETGRVPICPECDYRVPIRL